MVVGNSTIGVFHNSNVVVCDNSRVLAYDKSRIEARDFSCVWVLSHDCDIVKLSKFATIKGLTPKGGRNEKTRIKRNV